MTFKFEAGCNQDANDLAATEAFMRPIMPPPPPGTVTVYNAYEQMFACDVNGVETHMLDCMCPEGALDVPEFATGPISRATWQPMK